MPRAWEQEFLDNYRKAQDVIEQHQRSRIAAGPARPSDSYPNGEATHGIPARARALSGALLCTLASGGLAAQAFEGW
ncbi:MAG: hypothetical protein IPL76_10950 [Gemmatimonadetes bacterium]|nr:hypothetical protein [Gemmatimonadota bacterium]